MNATEKSMKPPFRAECVCIAEEIDKSGIYIHWTRQLSQFIYGYDLWLINFRWKSILSALRTVCKLAGERARLMWKDTHRTDQIDPGSSLRLDTLTHSTPSHKANVRDSSIGFTLRNDKVVRSCNILFLPRSSSLIFIGPMSHPTTLWHWLDLLAQKMTRSRGNTLTQFHQNFANHSE